ncbi:MAG: energy-coupling factor transporter transmembrane component T family protein [bacterium]
MNRYTMRGLYLDGESFLHKLDVKAKIIFLSIAVVAALLMRNWFPLVMLFLILGVFLISLKRLRVWVVRDILMGRWIYLLTLLFHLLITLLSHRGGQPLTEKCLEGLERGIFFSLRIMGILMLTSFILRTTHPWQWAWGFSGGRLNSLLGRFGNALGWGMKMLTLLWDEAERIKWAQIGRGWQPKGNLRQRIEGVKMVLLPLISIALHRAEEFRWAIEARGIKEGISLPALYQKRWGMEEWALIGVGVSLLLALRIK